jgi:hypothetical protein
MLAGLLAIERDVALPLAERMLADEDDASAEAALLALAVGATPCVPDPPRPKRIDSSLRDHATCFSRRSQ